MKRILEGIKYWAQLLMLPVYWFSFLFPRDKSIWLFGSTFGRRFADNPRYLYLYVSQHSSYSSDELKKKMADRVKKWQSDANCDKIRPVWISHNKEIVKFLNNNGYESYYNHSMKGIWYCLRGRVYIFDNYSKDISFWLSGGAKKVNLWHGVGNKRINYDNQFDKVRHPKNAWERFKYFPRRLSDEKPKHYTLATSDMMADIFESAFNTDRNHIIVDGYPRNDVMFDDLKIYNLNSDLERETIDRIQQKKDENKKIIFYMPTFRESETQFFDKMNLTKFNDFLVDNNYMFYTKLHPKSKLKSEFERINYSNIDNINSDVDTYSIIKLVDMLTTDYSSIYSDFLMLNRPSVMFPYDFEEYSRATRECYFEYDEYIPEKKAYTMDEFMQEIREAFENDTCERGRLDLRQRMFSKVDGLSCERLCEKIKKLG